MIATMRNAQGIGLAAPQVGLSKRLTVIDLKEVARVYNNGSVIESRLTGWMLSGFKKYGEEVRKATERVNHTGEGEWTIRTAKKLGVRVPVIEASFEYRVDSKKDNDYEGKILMMLRNQFGGHPIN